jgi:hypothetical protein
MDNDEELTRIFHKLNDALHDLAALQKKLSGRRRAWVDDWVEALAAITDAIENAEIK